MKGKFIVLEGGEGSGKGVCMRYIEGKMMGKYKAIFTREPGGTIFGERLRSILLSGEMHGKISTLSELFTFCAIRANHCDEVIRTCLQTGRIVICDRFDPSTIAYQIYGRGMLKFADLFAQVNSIAKGSLTDGEIKPDLVVYLDIDPETGLKRARGRAEENTRFDEEVIEFHHRVREGYLAQLAGSSNWIKIDASQPEEAVKEAVWQAVKKTINEEVK